MVRLESSERAATSPVRSVLVARTTDLSPDPRVRKVLKTLREDGWTVDVACWSRGAGGPPVTDEYASRIRAFQRPAPYGSGMANLRSHLAFQRWLWRVSRSRTYSLYYACDLDTAWTLAQESRRSHVPMVFDQFDQFADRITVPAIHTVLARLERRSIAAADSLIVASPERAEGLRREAYVVENVPDLALALPSESRPTPDPRLSVIYAGVLHVDRGLQLAVSVAEQHPEWTLRIGGFGPLTSWIERAAAANPNIDFLGVLTPQQVIDQAARSSIVLALYDPGLRNNVTTASGKFWDALVAGTPIVAARGTAVGRRVEQHGLGWTIDYGDRDQLVGALHARSTWSQEELASFRARADMMLQENSWSAQQTRLLAAVEAATRTANV